MSRELIVYLTQLPSYSLINNDPNSNKSSIDRHWQIIKNDANKTYSLHYDIASRRTNNQHC